MTLGSLIFTPYFENNDVIWWISSDTCKIYQCGGLLGIFELKTKVLTVCDAKNKGIPGNIVKAEVARNKIGRNKKKTPIANALNTIAIGWNSPHECSAEDLMNPT